jgi:hypothetical protein
LKYTWTAAGTTANGTPIGNAHIGARISGGIATEALSLNDKYFHSGGPGNVPVNPARRTAMLATRAELAANDIAGAETAARGMWGADQLANYHPLGTLSLAFTHGGTATGYSRVLDLDRSVTTITYTIGGVVYTREMFASFPDDVIVIRLTASQTGRISFTARLAYPVEMEGRGASVTNASGNVIVLRGKAPANSGWSTTQGMNTEGRLRVLPEGGTVSASGGAVTVTNANACTLIFANKTSYNGFDKEPGTQGIDPSPIVQATLAAAAGKSYTTLLNAHMADYRALFRRVWTEINGSGAQAKALGFHYARYEMISTSRTGNRPHNQQGIWNSDWAPTSQSAHWLNENLQKYYSLTEPANLAECGTPLFNFIKELSITGTSVAATDWGFRGWTAGQSTDIWATATLATGNNEWAIWPMGGVWLTQHLWEHYLFGRDVNYLRTHSYPIMKSAAEFCLDYLVDDGTGRLLTSPSTSPENRFGLTDGGTPYAVTRGATMDMALIRSLFKQVIEASTILGVDATFRSTLQTTLPKLIPYQVSPSGSAVGELQEWWVNYSRLPGTAGNRYRPHRHASHIIAVWPLAEITERGTPSLWAAAKTALINRGSGGYHPDKGAMFARLKDGNRALSSNDTMPTGVGAIQSKWPPKYAAYAEMIVQSHTDAIEILPALPTDWASGKAVGLRARGKYELSIEWSAGELTKCQIDSHLGTTPTVRYKGAIVNLATDTRFTLVKLGTPPVGDTYQAENATVGGATPAFVESTNGGYNGTAYVNFNTTTSTLTFNNVDGNGGGTKSLAIRYALGATAARTGSLTVNGVTQSITFQPTGAWTTWQTLTVNITLNNTTTNSIQFAATGNDLANIDEITVP